MFHNRIYLGEVSHKKVWYRAHHPPILEGALFDRVNAVIEKNAEGSKASRTNREKQVFLLTGLLHCGCGCGFQLTSSTSVKKSATDGTRVRHRYYRSGARGKRVDVPCRARLHSADRLELMVLTALRQACRQREVVESAAAAAMERLEGERGPLENRHQQRVRERADVRRAENRLLDLVAAGALESIQSVKQKLQQYDILGGQLDSDIAELDLSLSLLGERQIHDQQLLSALKAFDDVFESLEPVQKREFLHTAIHRVNVHHDHVEIAFFDGYDALVYATDAAERTRARKSPSRPAKSVGCSPGVNGRFVQRIEWLPSPLAGLTTTDARLTACLPPEPEPPPKPKRIVGERARRWAKMLDEGVYPTRAALARGVGVSRAAITQALGGV